VGFHPHGTRAQILAELGLTAQDIAREVTEWASEIEEPVGDVKAL
jgi:1-deoxy-D-xylulose-5-phosphate synthase